ncbi:MAG: flotillin-like FloA family protein [Lentisphaeria bacterium]|nr:flotillin-like FloA family protein [Lentisphaeria bacterium]
MGWLVAPLLIAAVLALGAVIVFAMFAGLWIEAKANRVPVTLPGMVMMRLRHVDPAQIVKTTITLWKAGAEVSPEDLEAHILSGGNLPAASEALIIAQKAGLDTTFKETAAIDLAGRDVLDAIRTRVKPKVLNCPPEGAGKRGITGVAQDGIRLAIRARVTVRTRLDRIIGGAGPETILARVGEGIVAAIGQAKTHNEMLGRPERVTEYLLAKGLDSGTCFEILSIDVADIDVLDNASAKLRSAQAEADKQIAQAKAEARKAAAIAARREMKAKTVEMESKVIAAEGNVPLAVASAFGEKNLGRPRPLPPTVAHRVRWRIAR